MAKIIKSLALVIQLTLNALALALVVAWPYNTFRRAGWPQIDDNTFLIGAALVVVVLGMLPVLLPRLCPDRNSYGRALLLTGWPLILFSTLLAVLQRIPVIGFAATVVLWSISAIQSMTLGLLDIAISMEKGPV